MSDHEIVWTFDRDTVTSKTVCTAAPDADCRLDISCECEYFRIERDATGPFHTQHDDYNPRDVGVRHEMTPGGECNIVLTVDESDGPTECAAPEVSEFEIARTPVEFVWTGDTYEWAQVTSS